MVQRGTDGALGATVIVTDIAAGNALETRRLMIDGPGALRGAALVADIAALLITAGQRCDRASAVFPLADAFSFSAPRLARADRSLIDQQDGPAGHVVLALRSWLRRTRMIERLLTDPQALLAEATSQIGWALPRRCCVTHA